MILVSAAGVSADALAAMNAALTRLDVDGVRARSPGVATRAPQSIYQSGVQSLAWTWTPRRPFKLVYARVHFSGAAGGAPFVLRQHSPRGADFGVVLHEQDAGVGADVFFRVCAAELRDPSPWSFAAGDGLALQWNAPCADAIAWAAELGVVLLH